MVSAVCDNAEELCDLLHDAVEEKCENVWYLYETKGKKYVATTFCHESPPSADSLAPLIMDKEKKVVILIVSPTFIPADAKRFSQTVQLHDLTAVEQEEDED